MNQFEEAVPRQMDRIYKNLPLLQCPCCHEKFPDNSIRMHIFHRAKSEVFDHAMGFIKNTPHFNFYKKHTVGVRRKHIWKL